ncbi:MAG: heat shock protein DnaJ domain protein [Myxococcales bacterium]|nr:heat shock protein DnaJ domain protein [Myxococcales bacterium]
MATGPLSIKLRCASWQQLATIYKRDLSRGTMFLKAGSPPPLGTEVRIDLTLPSSSVIVLTGLVDQHLTDPQRGAGVELKLAPIPASSVWMIESALASESKRRNTPAAGVPVVSTSTTSGPIPAISDSEDVVAAEQDLIKALLSEAESLRKLNPFLVLGVGYEATDADVRAAFGELTKRYHPDLFARYESTELRQVAAEIFILIRDAYRKLGDESGRSQALASLGRPAAAPRAVPLRAPTPPPVQIKPPLARPSTSQIPPIPRPNEMPKPIQDGTPTARPGEIPPPPTAAVPPLAPARPSSTTTVPIPSSTRTPSHGMPRVAMDPPAPRAAPSPTRSQGIPRLAPEPTTPPPVDTSDVNPIEELMDQGKFDEAVVAYKVAAKKNPSDRSARAGIEVAEGLRAIAQRDRLEAAQRFEAALEIDPSNERAARELADMRRQATNERKGLLTRLMGKKE